MKKTAIVVVLISIFALTVNVFAAGYENFPANEYVFTSCSRADSGGSVSSVGTTNTEVSDKWALLYATENTDIKMTDSCFCWESDASEGFSALVFELHTDTAGELTPNVTVFPSGTPSEFEVYLVENKEENTVVDEAFLSSLSVSDRLGVFSPSASDCGFDVNYFPRRTVGIGSYYLIFIPSDNDFSLMLSSFALSENLAPEEANALVYNTDFSVITIDEAADNIKDNLTVVSWKNNTLDLDKTAPYSVETEAFKNSRTSRGINEFGIFATFLAHAYDNDIADRSILALRVKIPRSGKYLLSVENAFDQWWQTKTLLEGSAPNTAYTRVFFGKATEAYAAEKIEDNINGFLDLGWYNSASVGNSAINTVYVPVAGEYYVLFISDEESLVKNPHTNSEVPQTNETVGETEYQWFLVSGITLTPISNDASAAVQSEYETIVRVDVENCVESDIEVGSAKVRAVASDLNGIAIGDKVIIPETAKNIGEIYTATAPEISGYKFLYWQTDLGLNKKIESYDSSYAFAVPGGGKFLTAVYQNAAESQNIAVFYNGNGQVLDVVDGDTYVIPELPSMSGFGNAKRWALFGEDEAYMPGDVGNIKGEMRFVAQYGLPDRLSVEVSDGCSGGGEYFYGDNAVLTAPKKLGTLLFNYWTDSNGEILSFEPTYNFVVANDCAFVAVYKEFLPNMTEIKKILVMQNGDYTITRFIGIDNVLEKGVLIGENADFLNYALKMPMTTESELFSIQNETGLPVRGYALLENGKIIYSDD